MTKNLSFSFHKIYTSIVSLIKPKEGQSKRKLYIDVIKGIAMLAVLVDHASGYSIFIAQLKLYSYFSVTLFILVLGYNLYFSYERRDDTSFKAVFSKLSKFLIFYVVVNALLLLWQNNKIDLKILIDNVIYFKASNAYYFCLMYIQLMLVSGIVFRLVKLSKYFFTDIILLVISYYFSLELVRHTFILPVYGGGQFLFGGTYLFIMILGYIFAKWFTKYKFDKFNYIFLALSVALLLIMLRNIQLIGGNPPNKFLMIYATAIFLTIVFIQKVIDIHKLDRYFINLNFFGRKIALLTIPASMVAIIGRYSLHIFLWQHLFIYNILPPIMKPYDVPGIILVLSVAFIGVILGIISEFLLKMFKKYLL